MEMDTVMLSDSTPSPAAEQMEYTTQYEEKKKPEDVSIDATIQRGEVLKKRKRLLGFQNTKSSLHVVDEDECPMNKYRDREILKSRSRKPIRSQPRICNAKTCSNTYKKFGSPTRSHVSRSTSPGYVTRPICSRAFTSASVTLNNKRRILRCPLRIAELATPTKRHCIETWRDRYTVLPSHMLERLKQHVMNQKIVASIPDAVNCFKNHKNAANSSGKRADSRCRNPRKIKRSQEMDDIRIMSAVFAHRVAAQLIKPMNIYLSEDLQKIGNIVGEEIAQLIQNRRICADYVYDRELLKEMSAKVTVWISDILASAQYKLLEDELRVIKTKENKMGKEGNLVTLIDQYVRWQMEDGPDLEEEEGPALDALDTLVDNVLDICLPRTDSSSFDYESPVADSDNRTIPTEEKDPNINEDDEDRYKDIEDKPSDIEENTFSEQNTPPPETQKPNDLPDVTGTYDMPERLKQENSDDDSDSKYGSTVELESNASNASNAGDSKIVFDDEENRNVSDVNITLEDSLDNRKKVKFTQNDEGGIGTDGTNRDGTARTRPGGDDRAGAGTRPGGNDRAGPGTRPGGNDRAESETRPGGDRAGAGTHKPRRISNATLDNWATTLASDIVFQPPNPSLLSVVDESWPDDYMIPTLKPSSSVSKSVTSLGKIKEVDEPDIQDDRNKQTGVFKQGKFRKDFKVNSIYMHGGVNVSDLFEQDDENSISPNQTIKNVPGTSDKDELIQDVSPKSFKKIPPSRLLSDLQALIAEQAEQIREKQIREESYIDDGESFNGDGKGDYTITQIKNQDDTDTEKNPIIQAIKEKLKSEAKIKFDYRVRPQTAPAWAITSPSEDSMPVTRKKVRLGSCELRKWCKDIEHTLINLEEWNKWMESTCKKVLYMQEKTETIRRSPPQCRIRVIKEWIKLKKSIDKDAILWRKLNDRTYEVLKTYPARSKFTSRSKSPVSKQKHIKKESLFEAMHAIEGLSMGLHRSIVSTEHVVRCHCQTLLAKPQAAETTKKLREK